jgi:hypothetical protein
MRKKGRKPGRIPLLPHSASLILWVLRAKPLCTGIRRCSVFVGCWGRRVRALVVWCPDCLVLLVQENFTNSSFPLLSVRLAEPNPADYRGLYGMSCHLATQSY